MEWFPVEIDGLDPEQPARALYEAKIQGKRLCLVHHRGKWHALDARCPHANGPLADGWVDEQGCVVCPWHRFAFDLNTGQSESGGYFVETYATRIKNRRLLVKLSPKKPWWRF